MNQKPLVTNTPNNGRPSNQNPPIAAKSSRAAASDSARLNANQRNVFRMMLATGATIAVVISAQAMATLDRSSAAAQPTVSTTNNAVSSLATVVPSQSTGRNNRSSTSSNTSVVQPSVSQPRPATRSSR